VPRNERPNPIRSRLRSLLLALIVGAALVVTTGMTALASATGRLDPHVSGITRAFILGVAVLFNVVLFAFAFRLLTAEVVAVRDLLPGATFAALGWQALQALGTVYVSRVVSRNSDIYGVFGVVLGLFAWIYLAATLTVLAAEINVVRACKLWPRSLLSPFVDGPPLTPADERAYVSYVTMRRHKVAERIDVDFDGGEHDDAQSL
jgi:YihY family inner membrane protein